MSTSGVLKIRIVRSQFDWTSTEAIRLRLDHTGKAYLLEHTVGSRDEFGSTCFRGARCSSSSKMTCERSYSPAGFLVPAIGWWTSPMRFAVVLNSGN